MRTYFDCIPCLTRQALDSVRFVTSDEMVHEHVLRDVLRAASEMDLLRPPPAMGQQIQRTIRELTGEDDPYHEVKNRFNQLALILYPELRKRVERAGNPLKTAVQLAIAVDHESCNSNFRRQDLPCLRCRQAPSAGGYRGRT